MFAKRIAEEALHRQVIVFTHDMSFLIMLKEATAFLEAGCPRILVSHPGRSAADVDCTIVHGINDGDLRPDQRIVSAASCTTNAAVPILDLLEPRTLEVRLSQRIQKRTCPQRQKHRYHDPVPSWQYLREIANNFSYL